ncbi:hypothetical protein O1611_g6458 [Lasiodiplodia mahajangana]|uniref:Uncharacterized protein n=1 Tax=Lasiodiplodia mahajangana TaxID=1108764 RepID=A0ACC2JIC8_9PEZI|nr:hypothetical protein O1611_g6458 [Lasiodiplodia mahajangana]
MTHGIARFCFESAAAATPTPAQLDRTTAETSVTDMALSLPGGAGAIIAAPTRNPRYSPIIFPSSGQQTGLGIPALESISSHADISSNAEHSVPRLSTLQAGELDAMEQPT